MVTTSLQGRRAAGAESLRSSRSRLGILVDVKAAFEASYGYILSYNVVQDHEGDIHQGVSRFQTAGGPHLLRPFCVESLGIISKIDKWDIFKNIEQCKPYQYTVKKNRRLLF